MEVRRDCGKLKGLDYKGDLRLACHRPTRRWPSKAALEKAKNSRKIRAR